MILQIVCSSIFLVLLIIVSIVIFIKTSPQFGAKKTEINQEILEKSDNFYQGKFNNIENTSMMNKMDLSAMVNFFTKGNTVPNTAIPMEKIDHTQNINLHEEKSEVKVTWFGHSTLLLDIDDKKIFLDPMFSDRPSPHPWLGFKRFNEELPVDIDNIPKIDAVIISHDHYDHLDYSTIVKIKDRVKMFYVPLGVGGHLKSWGVSEEKIVELNWWEETQFEGLTFISTPSRHFSGRGLSNRDSTLWSSWIIRNEETSIFFSGDGGYSKAFKEIGDKFGPFDLTLLECGQYNEAWSDIHMMPEETAKAHLDLKGKLLMPIHWGAFKLSIHPWNEPVERLLKEADSLNINVTTPKIGETLILNKSEPTSKWWITN